MNCFTCKGDMEEGKTTHVVELENNCIIIIKNVPCRRCTQCGEVWYSGTVSAQIEKIVDAMETSLMEIAIVDYSQKAAS